MALGGRRAGPIGAAVSDIVNVPWSVECKRSKRRVPEGRWIDQARDQGRREGRPWLLVVAGHNDRAPIAVLEFAEFVDLARAAGRIGCPAPVELERSRVTIPSVVIRFELGQPPLVTCDWDTDLNDARMTEWLDREPAYHRLISDAIEFAERERAA